MTVDFFVDSEFSNDTDLSVLNAGSASISQHSQKIIFYPANTLMKDKPDAENNKSRTPGAS